MKGSRVSECSRLESVISGPRWVRPSFIAESAGFVCRAVAQRSLVAALINKPI
jgi:hypothetical protein